MSSARIGFIGCGNMATSLIKGLRCRDAAQEIWATAPHETTLKKVAAQYGVHIRCDNNSVIDKVDVVVLAVKPHQLKSVCEEISAAVQQYRPLIISVAAGIKVTQIASWLGDGVAVVRAMPNTPCAIGAGVTALLANQYVTGKQRQCAELLFNAVGLVFWVLNDEKIDTVTALAGSGPAYVFLFMEALQQAAIDAGLEEGVAKQMTKQLMLGAAQMAIPDEADVTQLRIAVTSPGGSTEHALKTFEQRGFCEMIAAAFNSARQRAKQLSENH